MNTKILRPKKAQLWSIFQILGCLALGATSLQAQGVKLRWPANPETNITGYVIYLGTVNTSFTPAVTVGNATNHTLTNLTAGITYYVDVAAVNEFGLESPLTNTSVSFRINAQPMLSGPLTVDLAKNTATPVAGLAISDDNAVANYTVTLSSTRGTVNVSTMVPGGVTAAQVTGNGSGTISITASLSAINATLGWSNGLVYTGRLNLVGTDSFITTVNDNDTLGLGGAANNVRVVALNVMGDSFDAWRNQHFAAGDLTDASKEAAVWGDLADPDLDGRQNLMEFALTLNPLGREASSAGLVSDIVELNGKKYLTLTFRQLINAAGIQYLPEVSGDKKAWTSGAGMVQLLSSTDLDAQTQLVTYQDLTPIDVQAPRFIRLKIVRN